MKGTRDVDLQTLREQIVHLAGVYGDTLFAETPFQPGVTAIPASGKVLGGVEIAHLVDAALDGWLTTGRFNAAFESRLAEWLDVKHLLTVNSGSSANLLALSALTSPLLGVRRLRPGDEVITVAAGFPTTINPILQNGLIPVFVDVRIPDYNIDVTRIDAAISPKTRAIMIAHTLGNPFDLDAVVALAKRYDLWLVEDCCDALGSLYANRKVGTFGDVATLSFYPAHHITMGEGGAVFTNSGLLRRILLSMRDWGRDCHCEPGHDNTCHKRFEMQLGELPAGYDHKYIYSHVGYNLKITDLQAAVGLAQLDRLDGFLQRRRENFRHLSEGLADLESWLILPQATQHSDPAWFGFPLTLRASSLGERTDLLRHLESKRIGTRLLFAGNVLRQPYFQGLPHRVSGGMEQSDRVMAHTFWIGLHPGLEQTRMEYVCAVLRDYFKG